MPLTSDILPPIIFGSRILTLTTPPMRGTDIKIYQRLYNTLLDLMDEGPAQLSPYIQIHGHYTCETFNATRRLQKYFHVP
ncbi:MAG: hypothetical protein OWS74_03790, partial [Firmicutes bacterium]|nr:hypothetical protein [Bacillota bacterium]